jgi:hypothetical protein
VSDLSIELWKGVALAFLSFVVVIFTVIVVIGECAFGWSNKVGSRHLAHVRTENQTNKSSEPSGTITRSESRYS